MKQLIFFLPFLAILCFAACKKDDDKNQQYSKWYVGVDSFSTNNVRVYQGNARTDLIAYGKYGFDFTFNVGYFPVSGNLRLDCSIQNPQYTCMSVTYHDTGYLSPDRYAKVIQATSANGKASYVLAPTWFFNSYRPLDSVLVSGVFNEP